MYSINSNNILGYNEEILDEFYIADVLLNATMCCCKEKEFRGEYYGIPDMYVQKISNERNEYLSLMTILADRLRNINNLYKQVEQALLLHKDSDNCS